MGGLKIKNMIFRTCLLVVGQMACVICFAQNAANFDCPLKKAKIVVKRSDIHEHKKYPGATIKGKGSGVYSCSNGTVIALDTIDSRINVYIRFGNYTFSYHRLKSVLLKEMQEIKQGEKIGDLPAKATLFLITSRNDSLINPKEILKCKEVFTN